MCSWKNNVREVVPYVPGEQPKQANVLKLNTNENPYPPAPEVMDAIALVSREDLSRYPDPDCTALREAIGKQYGFTKNEVFVGVGSDEVLSTAFLTFFASDTPILYPDITYEFYPVWANLYGIPFRCPKVDENFRIHKEDYYQKNGGIVIPNPNAPTSIGEPLDFVEDILQHNPDSVVIIDEAYADFSGVSALPLVKKYDNLLVTQTFSKSRSLAGMRIGYAIGQPELIAAMSAVRNSINSYTMNHYALAAGKAAVEADDYFRENVRKICSTREQTAERLRSLGFRFPDSRTNFFFAEHERVPARQLFEDLRKAGILVRYFDRPRVNNRLRITVGTPEQMDRLCQFLEEYLKKN